jgi:site-specific DNA recombinase
MKARRWSQATISAILRDPFYKGSVDLDGELVHGQHEPIIDADLWDQVAAIRAAGRKAPAARGGRPTRGNHLFRNGTLRCGRCGGAMVPRSSRGGEHDVYRCHTRMTDTSACAQPTVRRDVIDTAVLDYFSEVGLSVEETKRQIADALAHQGRLTRAQREEAERQHRTAAEAWSASVATTPTVGCPPRAARSSALT